MDYVPAKIKAQMHSLTETLRSGERNPNAFADVEIIPGEGFKWNSDTGTLQAQIPIKDIPAREQSTVDMESFAASALGLKMAGIKAKAKLTKK